MSRSYFNHKSKENNVKKHLSRGKKAFLAAYKNRVDEQDCFTTVSIY